MFEIVWRIIVCMVAFMVALYLTCLAIEFVVCSMVRCAL
jgi:hypothetical protein